MKFSLVFIVLLSSAFATENCRYLGALERPILKRNACFAIAKIYGKPGMINGCLSQASFNLCAGDVLELLDVPNEDYGTLDCTMQVTKIDAVVSVNCSGND